jgi:hypothetical protein
MFPEPRQIPFVPVFIETGPFDPVVLPGIDHQLGIQSQTFGRLVHLFRIEDGHVPIFFPPDPQGGGFDFGHIIERR